MANLKRNSIEIVKEVKAGEVITEKYWTPVFIDLDVVYEALDIMERFEDKENPVKEREMLELLIDFTANKIYGKEFTPKQLRNGLHAPQAIETLQEQLIFIAQGEQTDETKKFLEKKN